MYNYCVYVKFDDGKWHMQWCTMSKAKAIKYAKTFKVYATKVVKVKA